MAVRSKKTINAPIYGITREGHDQVIVKRPTPGSREHRLLKELHDFDRSLDLIQNPLVNNWELWRLRRGHSHLKGSKPLYHYYHIYTRIGDLVWDDGEKREPGDWLLRVVRKNDLRRVNIDHLSRDLNEDDLQEKLDMYRGLDEKISSLGKDYLNMENRLSMGFGKSKF